MEVDKIAPPSSQKKKIKALNREKKEHRPGGHEKVCFWRAALEHGLGRWMRKIQFRDTSLESSGIVKVKRRQLELGPPVRANRRTCLLPSPCRGCRLGEEYGCGNARIRDLLGIMTRERGVSRERSLEADAL